MDQTAVAGIGNIYRAEILFKAGILFTPVPSISCTHRQTQPFFLLEL